MIHENHAKDHRSYGRFKESNFREREKYNVNCVHEKSTSDDNAEVCGRMGQHAKG
jgi:hypothetical protein